MGEIEISALDVKGKVVITAIPASSSEDSTRIIRERFHEAFVERGGAKDSLIIKGKVKITTQEKLVESGASDIMKHLKEI